MENEIRKFKNYIQFRSHNFLRKSFFSKVIVLINIKISESIFHDGNRQVIRHDKLFDEEISSKVFDFISDEFF